MSPLKPLQWVGLALAVVCVSFLLYSHLQYFGSVSFLGGILLIEIIIASLWKYDQRFFGLLLIVFLWAGMRLPFQSAWTSGRWLVLSAGALIGYIIWLKAPRRPFRSMHLIAFFCIGAAFVSATVSPFTRMASLKALSLFLLFLYCASGARLAVLGREERFFRGLLWGSESLVFATAACYLGFGQKIWGNPNSLGAVMSIGLFPIVLWGWLTSDGPILRFRRLTALLLCVYLIVFSMERAGMISMLLVSLVFCLCLHQYKLLVKATGMILATVAVAGMLAPTTLEKSLTDLRDTVLYKGHKEADILGSRRTPWEESIATIKEHPWFGTGYGTSPTGEDPGLSFGKYASSAETEREHGSSYITIAGWVGLLGALPFVAILAWTVANVWKVCAWMNRTADPRHYSIPLAMVVLSGLIHANFEDWLFSVGSYLAFIFWIAAFLLVDLAPVSDLVPSVGTLPRTSSPLPASFGVVAPNR